MKFFTPQVAGVALLHWGCRGEPHSAAPHRRQFEMLEIAEESAKKITKPAAKKRSGGGIRLSTTRLKKMIAKLMNSLENDEQYGKVSVSELLKLLQVYKELTEEQVKEVEVRWVDRLHQDDEPGK
jgi:hypothetical protein